MQRLHTWRPGGGSKSAGCVLLLIVVSMWSVPTFGEDRGALRGEVRDRSTGNALVGAIVRVVGTTLETVSDGRGTFLIPNAPAGAQTVDASFLGLGRRSEPVTVAVGKETPLTIYLGDAIETILVRGTASGTARSLNRERVSENLVNIVAADAIGRFPDQNVAEALSRVPGLSIQRDRGEGRYVNIRGIDSELNAYSIDGISLAAPRGAERAVLLDIIPSGVVDRLEVSKTIMPDQPADAIGGGINIASASAYDYGGPVARTTVQSNYSNLTDEWTPHVEGALGDVFGPEQTFGALLAVSYDKRKLGANALWTDPWELAESPASGQQFYLPAEYNVQSYSVTRKRTGATANLEYRPSETSSYFLRGNYNQFSDDSVRHRSRIELDEDGVVALDDSSAIVDVGDEPALGETEVRQEVRLRKKVMSIWGTSVGGENEFGPYTIDYTVGYSYADEDGGPWQSAEYVLSGTTQVAYADGRDINPAVWFTGQGADATDAANFEFDVVDDRPYLVKEDHWEYIANIRRDLTSFEETYVKTGVRARFKDKRAHRNTIESNANPPEIDTLDAVTIGTGTNPFNTGTPLVDPHVGVLISQQYTEFDFEHDLLDEAAARWQSSENVLAGYMLASHTIDRLELMAGIRYERTDYGTSGSLVDEDAETATPIHANNSYDEWLPGIHARYGVSDDIVVRASYSETLSRPGFEQSSISTVIDGDEIERGNPELTHALARNYDVSVQFFLPESLGILSFAGFYKDIDGFLFTRVFEEDIGGETFEVTSYENGEEGWIYGFEVGYQQQLLFLPSPFDGLSVFANAFWGDSKATLPTTVDRSDPEDLDIEFPRQSEFVGNFALTYEKGSVFLRAAVNYRDGWLERVGDEPQEDRYYGDHIQWDISSRYSFGERWSVFANFVNADEEPLRGRYGRSGRTVRYEDYSWSAQVGVDYAL